MSLRTKGLCTVSAAALLMFSLYTRTALGQGVGAVLQHTKVRKGAPELDLQDSFGKLVSLKDYRGKVVLLDFWATWCHGCKEEIPWFTEFERKYSDKGLSVIGVSLDEDGWKVVKPFTKAMAVPYRIVLGNESTAKEYGVGSMPGTFIIDRDGRIAATYMGMADKNDVERNIQKLLSQK
jgi:peroxiredoxin